MKHFALVAMLVAASAIPAVCASYDDLNLGIQAHNADDPQSAIAFFDRALAAGDLTPGQQYVAHLDRGEAQANEQHFDQAIADYTASLTLRPGDFVALSNRSIVYFRTEKFNESVHDLDDIIAARPEDTSLYFRRAIINIRRGALEKGADDIKTARSQLQNISADDYRSIGVVEWQVGRIEEADADFSSALSKGSSVPYSWLWLTLAEVRLGKPVPGRTRPNIDKGAWPNPIMDFFMGNVTQDAVFATASQASGETLRGQTCEANFYVGEWLLQHHDTANARPLIEKAASDCPTDFLEWSPAQSELKNLSIPKAQ